MREAWRAGLGAEGGGRTGDGGGDGPSVPPARRQGAGFLQPPLKSVPNLAASLAVCAPRSAAPLTPAWALVSHLFLPSFLPRAACPPCGARSDFSKLKLHCVPPPNTHMRKPPRLPPSQRNPDFPTRSLRLSGSPAPANSPAGYVAGPLHSVLSPSALPGHRPSPTGRPPNAPSGSCPALGAPPPRTRSAPRACGQSCSRLSVTSLGDLETGLAGLDFVQIPHRVRGYLLPAPWASNGETLPTPRLGRSHAPLGKPDPRPRPRKNSVQPTPTRASPTKVTPTKPRAGALPFARGVTPVPFPRPQNSSRMGLSGALSHPLTLQPLVVTAVCPRPPLPSALPPLGLRPVPPPPGRPP